MFRSTIIALMLLMASTAQAEIQGTEMVYKVGGTEFTGYLAYDDSSDAKRPGVLVVHEWWGHNDYARSRAEQLAAMGYTAMALDMYGSGKLADHPKDAEAFMNEMMGDLSVAEARFNAALDILKHHHTVARNATAAIGYCMGGAVVTYMARAGADLDAVVSFHGAIGFAAQAPQVSGPKAKVLALTGAADPFVPEDQIATFETAMKDSGMAYEIVRYPGVQHSFTNPAADGFGSRFELPLKYDAAADADSWLRMATFFADIFK